jgi:hypothetical protein
MKGWHAIQEPDLNKIKNLKMKFKNSLISFEIIKND